MSFAGITACTVVMLLAGCGQKQAAHLAAISQAHIAHFAAFDRWVRRASLGEGGFGISDAWPEAVFARLRHDPEVAAAWVNRPEFDMPYVSFPPQAPPVMPLQLEWVLLKRPGFEILHAAEARLGETTPCLLLSHQSNAKPRVQVIVAYRLTDQ